MYVGLEEVQSSKVPGILKAIKSVMDTIDPQWMQKLISTGTDGVSVVMGKEWWSSFTNKTECTSSDWDSMCSS